jgi:hypothetical protein
MRVSFFSALTLTTAQAITMTLKAKLPGSSAIAPLRAWLRTEVTAITLSNNQSFDFKFNLPTKIPVKLRLTLTLSENNQFTVESTDWIKERLLANIAARYRLGMNFEPQRYFSTVDAPWAGVILLEWSDDAGANWHSTVYDADYDEVFTAETTDITVVEN